MRDDFAPKVKEALAKRVRYLCSRPGCRCATVAPSSTDEMHTVSVGVAAHITAAAVNGPRYDTTLTPADRKAAANGIWLCQTCAKLIDSDTLAFPVPLLRDWKARAEQEAAAEIGKPVGTLAAAGDAVQAVDRHLALKIAELQSTLAATHDALDTDLDETKALIDAGGHAEARPLVERLLRRNAGRLSDRQRWRAESQRALCLFADSDFTQAGELLVAAAKLLPADEKARANEACGHELLGDAVRAHALAARVRADFPGSLAALACWIRTAPSDVLPERCLAEAGALAKSEAEVATALAARFAFRHETEFAERAANDATRLDPEAGEGRYLLGISLHQRGHALLPARDARPPLQEAEACYTRVTDAHRGRVDLRVTCLHNRGIVRGLLGQYEQAADDFRDALRLRPDDAGVFASLAFSLSALDRHDEAVASARRAAELAPDGAHDFLYAATLVDRGAAGDREEAVQVFGRIVARGGPASDDAIECRVLTLCDLGRLAEAEAFIGSLPEAHLLPARRAAYAARILLGQGRTEEACESARRAEAGCGDWGRNARLCLAQLLVRLDMHAEGVRLLSDLYATGVYDTAARMLLHCASRTDDHAVVLRVCGDLRESGAGDDPVRRLEFELLSWYDPRRSAELIQDFLTTRADDRRARLLLSLLGQRCEEPAWGSSAPDALPDPADCDPASVARLAVGLLVQLGRPLDAVRFAYAVLRVHPESADAHHLYFTLFFRLDLPEDAFPTPDEAGPDAAVGYREDGTESEQWVVIEPNGPVAALHEYAPDHPRASRLLGVKPGERFRLTTGIQERWATVVGVRDKHLFRFERCRDGYETQFPDRHDFQAVKVIYRQPDGSERVDLSAIYADHDRRRAHVHSTLQLFRSRLMPVSLLSDALGRDLFETLTAVCHPRLGLRCWSGDRGEWEQGVTTLQSDATLVFDVTALFTLRRLDLLDSVAGWAGVSVVVAQGVFDHLRDLEAAGDVGRQGGHILPDGAGGFTFVEVTELERRERDEFRRSLVRWVRRHARVVGCPELAALPPAVRREWLALFGRDGAESIALASRPGHVLWAEDLSLAIAGRTEYPDFRRVWAQPALRAAADHGVISEDRYVESAARLVEWNYSQVQMSARVLTRAGELAGWNSDAPPFADVLRTLGSPNGDLPAQLNVAAEFVVQVFARVGSSLQREAVVRAVLRNFARQSAASALDRLLGVAFGLNAAGVVEARRYIRHWLRHPLVWVPQ